MQLTAKNSIFIDLEHAVNVVLEFDLESCEEVHRVETHKVAVSASNEYMLFSTFILFITH
jgi:hypothetical protein